MDPIVATTLTTLQCLDRFNRKAFIAHALEGTPLQEATRQVLRSFSILDRNGEVPTATIDAVKTLREAGRI